METFLKEFSVDPNKKVEIIKQLKEMMVERLNLDRDPSEIPDNEAIFNKGLELDSVDALEVIVNIERSFKIKLKEYDLAESETFFQTLSTATDFILLKIAETNYINNLKDEQKSASPDRLKEIQTELQNIEEYYDKRRENADAKVDQLKQKYLDN
jgi:acyl carrier protein